VTHVLFVHRHGPGQFVHLAEHLASRGVAVTLLCETSDRPMRGVRVVKHRTVGPKLARQSWVEYQLRVGTRAAEVMDRLKREEGEPDLIYGHVGWGSLLFARDLFPRTPIAGYCEFFYQAKGADVGFDPAHPTTFPDTARLKARNFAQTTTLPNLDLGISPTRWQKSLYPRVFSRRIGVVHDGIDTGFCHPDPDATFGLPGGRQLKAGDRVVTFAARNLEPYRGFPQFMRAAASLAKTDPKVIFVVAGGDGTSYGRPPSPGKTWRQVLMAETGIDPRRIHFVGTLAHPDLIRLFQVSAAHIYLTYPFVLSWSMLEAMASGVLLVGSATQPVREFVEEGKNGLLVPFFDVEALTRRIAEALDGGAKLSPLRSAARQTIVDRVALGPALAAQTALLSKLIATHRAKAAA
jgi:glycosyltransferase involved in cell wall biosynthesis